MGKLITSFSAKQKPLPLAKYKNHFEWIDILRGAAALFVVFFHVRVDLWVGWEAIRAHPEKFSTFDKIVAWLSIPMPFFGSGVMLFFIISGFCIHYPTALEKKIDVKYYFIRRFLRIIPPYVFAIGFSLLTEWICNHYFALASSNSITIKKTFLMIQNYPPFPGQLISNTSLWSLPVEIEFYILYPLTFAISHYIGKKTTIISIFLVSLIALLLNAYGLHWLEGNFAQYWIIWCSGSILSQFIKDKNFPVWKNYYWIPMMLLFATGGILVANHVPIIDHLTWGAAYFFLLWYCLSLSAPSTFLPKPLLRLLFWLGKISFSLYLVHFPFFRLLGSIWVNWKGSKPSNLLIAFGATFLAVLLGGVFYTLIEKPSHNYARILGKKKVLINEKQEV